MGDVGDVQVVENWTVNPESGKTSIKCVYVAKGLKPSCEYAGPCGWAGVYWQEPPGNWGQKPESRTGGYDLTPYGMLRFSARAERDATVEFKVGGIEGLYGDSLQPARFHVERLTNNWQQFEIDLTKADLSKVIGGFAWVAKKELNPNGATFFLDDIRFELKTSPSR